MIIIHTTLHRAYFVYNGDILFMMRIMRSNIRFKCLCSITVFILVSVLSIIYLSKSVIVKSEDKIIYPVLEHLAKDTVKNHNLNKKNPKQNTTKRTGRPSNVVMQMDKKVLLMIEGIEKKDTTRHRPVIMDGIGNYTCQRDTVRKDKIEDILCMQPPKFLPQYKNPCWNSNNGQFRCLPYFQIIGMDKCGSTDLFDKIAKHPDILKNSGTLGKETMWWSWKRYGHWLAKQIKIESFDRYLQYFSKASAAIKSRPKAGLIAGDGTPMDLWDMSGWRSIPQNAGLKDPKFITPHLIKHLNPNVKLLIILRNPVDRLYSDYFFLKIGKLTPRAFHEHVVRSLKLLYQCTRKSTLRTCLYSRNLHVQSRARLHLGFYSVFLRDWFKVFPRHQFLILRTEDYSDKPKEQLKKAFSFLQLRNLSKTEVHNLAFAKRKHVTAAKKKAGKMLDKTRVILERLYHSFNSDLADILKDQRFSWP